MNHPFRAPKRASMSFDARAAGASFLAAYGRTSAVPSAVGGVHDHRRSREHREVSS